MLLIPVLALLLVLLFYKRPVNSAMVAWTPPPQTLWNPQQPPNPVPQNAVRKDTFAPPPAASAPPAPPPMGLDDVFRPR